MSPTPPTVHRTLYKRDSDGRIRTFFMESRGNAYWSTTGLIDGAQTATSPIYAEEKNVGKKNYRSADAQAVSEVENEYKKKLKLGYFEDIADVDKGEKLFPMLANRFQDLKKGLDWRQEWVSQPKIDGLRCLGRKQGLFTRKGEEYHVFKDILSYTTEINLALPSISLDGELYEHSLRHDLPEINSIARKRSGITEADVKAARLLNYNLYDLHDADNPDMPFDERNEYLTDIFNKYLLGNDFFELVPTDYVENDEEVDAKFEQYLLDEWEGQILRNAKGTYDVNKRSKHLIKRKEYQDKEFKVRDIKPGQGNWAGAAKIAVLENPHVPGDTFEAGIDGPMPRNQKILEEKDLYIDGDATVRFFKLSPKNVPLQGVVKAFYPGGRDV